MKRLEKSSNILLAAFSASETGTRSNKNGLNMRFSFGKLRTYSALALSWEIASKENMTFTGTERDLPSDCA